MSEELNAEAHKAHMKEQVWITESLKNEIINLSSKYIDRVNSDNIDEIQYKLSSFKTSAAKMFPKHREFVNHYQLTEVLEKFSAAWNFTVGNSGGILKCSYCACTKKRKSSNPAIPSQRKVPLTSVLKNQFKCPCKLNYSPQEFFAPTKNKMYYKVRITDSDFHHTHPLSNSFYKRTVFHSKCKRKIELKSFQNALDLLQVDPRLSNCALRKLLYNHMPTDFHFSPDFLRNFKLRAAIHHAKHQNGSQCTNTQAGNMLSE